MPTNAIVTLTVQWTPPSAAANSGSVTFAVTAPHNAQSVGQLDVNPAVTAPDVVPVPFGSVDKAKVAVVKNLTSSEIGLRINGAVADNVKIPAGGEWMYAAATAPAATALSSLDVVILTAPSAVEQVAYYVFGD